MLPLNPNLIVSILFCCIAAVAYIRLRRLFIRQKRQFTTLNTELDIALRCLNKKQDAGCGQNFVVSLEEAQIKTRLEQIAPTTHFNRKGGKSPVPKKYRHVKTLAGHGMKSDEIAAILNISPRETEQLVNLFKFAHQGSL